MAGIKPKEESGNEVLADAVRRSKQLICSRCNENEKHELNDPYCMECKIEIEGQEN